MVLGLWKEIVRVLIPGRVDSLEDVIANGVGIGMVVVVIRWKKIPVQSSKLAA